MSAFVEGPEEQRELAVRLAGAFWCGIARTGETCGAVTGALMVLGYRLGVAKDRGGLKKNGLRMAEKSFVKEFRGVYSTLLCNELRGVQSAGKAGYVKGNNDLCEQFVRDACEMVGGILRASNNPAGD